MRTKLLFGLLLLGTLVSSCYSEIIIDDGYIAPGISVENAIHKYDLWYVDINATQGSGEVPFLQRAFTITFNNGRLFANNNIVGIGKTGNGYGIDVGNYDVFNDGIRINHAVDGRWPLEVYVVNSNTLELLDVATNTSYYLKGYRQNTFDYDYVFYDNLKYFLQEYNAWEKTYTSEQGAINNFDEENFLQFFTDRDADIFRSSIDNNGTRPNNVTWDYEGDYKVFDVHGDETLKLLELDYDYLGDDYFEFYVINDRTIELYHPNSGTVYEFTGVGYREYLKGDASVTDKKRTKSTNAVKTVKRQRIK
ncbi:nicotinic acid mononucleotide adenyltransferase [Cellulophaga sp. 20_2_10]|uniref:nicotinic acid mononucleotide adenyltransferase n=1 Tax=Cellulophaga sp. 20_2_10 TaxID=2942476 RepID=UPI00201ABB24|nr:nicotinic acid mononucleotide adenyltransferase [Cellulophaga sp. 20_2_10]MCL5246553.1 nicotinic acid mononucleotide adenyltransferase [Cellulophaga sp. 20_2_10]